jgi:hypothetical protein
MNNNKMNNKKRIIIILIVLLILVVIFLFCKNISHYEMREDRDPIIFIPGLGGTQLENIETKWEEFPNCNILQRSTGLLWASNNPFPGSTCFMDLMKTEYDKDNNTLKTNKNIKINVKKEKIGDVNSTSCLNDSFPNCLGSKGVYGKYLFKSLTETGYKHGIDLYSAGYDFRLVPFGNALDYNTYSEENNHVGKYFLELMHIIEKAYNYKKKKVVLIGHSTGCKLICLFINMFRKFSEEGLIEKNWVDKHIKNTIMISPAFDGSPKALKSILSGDSFGLPVGKNQYKKKSIRYFASLIFNIPLLKQSYDKGIFVKVNDRKYEVGYNNEIGTESEMIKFLNNIAIYDKDFEDVVKMYENMLIAKILSFEDIKLKTYIIAGDNCNTPNHFAYDNIEFSNDPNHVNKVKGDGTIPLNTIELILNNFSFMINGDEYKINKWKNVECKKFISKNDKNLHTKLLKKKELHDYIINIVSRD